MRCCILLAFLFVIGCQSQPKTIPLLSVPDIDASATHFVGSALSGPQRSTTRATLANTDLELDVRLVALAKSPAVSSVAIGSRARLIVAGASDAPLLGSPLLTEQIRLVEGDAANRLAAEWSGIHSPTFDPIAESATVLPPGVTAEYTAVVEQPPTSSERLTLEISRDSASIDPRDVPLQYSLSVLKSNAAEPSFLAREETVLFNRTALNETDAFALLVPMSSTNSTATVFGIGIALHRATAGPAHDAAVAKCDADLQESARQLTTRPTLTPVGISQSAGIEAAFNGLTQENQRRSSLVYLADQTNAHLCQDVALVANNSVLATLTQKIDDAMKITAERSPDAIGWVLDRSAFELLTSLADSPDGSKLPPELASVLTQFAGEAARHPAALDEVAHGVGGETDLHNRIIAQNLVFLTDSSPSARVRAFDWLNSRQLAPAGFDPLGSARERREAISKSTSQP